MNKSKWLDAVLAGRWEDAKKILSDGGDIDWRDRAGRSALFQAVLNKDRAGVEWLVGAGCDVSLKDKLGKTALHYAAQGYDAGLTEFLCSHGAIADARDEHGNTLLSVAVFESRGRGDVIAILLRHHLHTH